MASGIVNRVKTIHAFMKVFDIPTDAMNVVIELNSKEGSCPTITVTRPIYTEQVDILLSPPEKQD